MSARLFMSEKVHAARSVVERPFGKAVASDQQRGRGAGRQDCRPSPATRHGEQREREQIGGGRIISVSSSSLSSDCTAQRSL